MGWSVLFVICTFTLLPLHFGTWFCHFRYRTDVPLYHWGADVRAVDVPFLSCSVLGAATGLTPTPSHILDVSGPKSASLGSFDAEQPRGHCCTLQMRLDHLYTPVLCSGAGVVCGPLAGCYSFIHVTDPFHLSLLVRSARGHAATLCGCALTSFTRQYPCLVLGRSGGCLPTVTVFGRIPPVGGHFLTTFPARTLPISASPHSAWRTGGWLVEMWTVLVVGTAVVLGLRSHRRVRSMVHRMCNVWRLRAWHSLGSIRLQSCHLEGGVGGGWGIGCAAQVGTVTADGRGLGAPRGLGAVLRAAGMDMVSGASRGALRRLAADLGPAVVDVLCLRL